MSGLPWQRRCFLAPKPIVAGAAVLLLLSVAGPAWGRTWRVEKDGSGDYTTIQPAVDAAAPGDTVLIGPGRYLEYAPYDFGARTEDTFVAVGKPNLTVRGTTRDEVIIGPAEYAWPTSLEPNGIQSSGTAPGLTVESLTVENVPDGIGFESGGVIANCTVRGARVAVPIFSQQAVRVSGSAFLQSREIGVFYAVPTTSPQVYNCSFDGSSFGFLASGATSILVEDSAFLGGSLLQFQSGAQGMIRSCTFDGGGIVILDARAVLVSNRVTARQGNALDVSAGYITGESNVFMGGYESTILLRDGTDAVLGSNHIINGGARSVRALHYFTPGHTLDLRNNWWGSPYGSDIRRWIYDGWDDEDVQVKVLYSPYAEQPVHDETRSIGQLKATFGDR